MSSKDPKEIDDLIATGNLFCRNGAAGNIHTSTDSLLQLLHDESINVQIKAVEILTQRAKASTDPDDLDKISVAANPRARGAVAGSIYAYEITLAVLSRDEDPEVAAKAIETLKRIGDMRDGVRTQ